LFYSILAKLVLIVHLIFILFVILGGLLTLYRRWAVWVHLPAALWGILIEFADWSCPLTALEVTWLQQAAEVGYSGGFVEYYLIALIYPLGLTRGVQLLLGFFAMAMNVLVYTLVWRVSRRDGAMRSERR
jgi:hypothetical protein